MESKPIVTSTTHTLPFDKLSPADFERMCLWLVEREGYERAEHLGAAGNEQGRDIIGWRGDALWAFQCKQVRTFGPQDALTEIEKVLSLPRNERPAVLMFLVACDVSANTRRQARERCDGRMECHFWAETELDEKVKRHQAIVAEFFRVPFTESEDSRNPPLSIKDILGTDTTPCLTGRQWASTSAPRKGEEVQVLLLITNESQVEAQDTRVTVHLPPYFVWVSQQVANEPAREPLRAFDSLPLAFVMQATADNADPSVSLTAQYRDPRTGVELETTVPIRPAREQESVWRMVDQKDILGKLGVWLDSLRVEQPVLVQLQGEPGVGKTRLLQQAILMAQSRGYHVFHELCLLGRGPLSGNPLRSILRRGFQELAPSSDVSQIVRGIGQDTNCNPEVVDTVADYLDISASDRRFVGADTDDALNQAISRFLIKFSLYKPVFIVVDDIDGTSESTVRLLQCLAEEVRDVFQPQVRILVSTGLEASSSSHILRELWTTAGQAGSWRVMRLARGVDTRELVEQTYPNSVFQPSWTQDLHRLCDGNPLLVLEVLRILRDNGKLSLRHGYWEPVNQPLRPLLSELLCRDEVSLEAVFKTRLLDLRKEEQSFHYLQMMAVLGREVDAEDIEFICSMTGLPRHAVYTIQKRLTNQQVLARTANGRWAITPRFLYDALIEDLEKYDPWLPSYHKQAAAYLETRYAGHPERADEIAFHYFQAQQYDHAVRFACLAAEWELSRNDLWRSIRLYEMALGEPLEGLSNYDQGQFRLALASLYRTAGEYEQAKIQLQQADHAFKVSRNTEKLAEVKVQMGRIAYLQQSYGLALDLFEQAQCELRGVQDMAPGALQRQLWRYHGVATIRAGQMELGEVLIAQALDAAQEGADANEVASIHLAVGLSYFKRKLLEKALEHYALAELLLGSPQGIEGLKIKAKIVASKATVHLQNRQDKLARAEYEEAIHLAQEITNPEVEAEACYGLGVLCYEEDQCEKAVNYLTYAARAFGRLKKQERTITAYEDLLRALEKNHWWERLLYEAGYASRRNALSPVAWGYVLAAFEHLPEQSNAYPELFDNTTDEASDWEERRKTE